jgi:hypothetical protein
VRGRYSRFNGSAAKKISLQGAISQFNGNIDLIDLSRNRCLIPKGNMTADDIAALERAPTDAHVRVVRGIYCSFRYHSVKPKNGGKPQFYRSARIGILQNAKRHRMRQMAGWIARTRRLSATAPGFPVPRCCGSPGPSSSKSACEQPRRAND